MATLKKRIYKTALGMKFLTTLIFLVLCFCSNAQHLPGGVASPYLWSTENKQITADSLRADSEGISIFQVVIPTSETENSIFTTGQTIVTSHRIALPYSGQYINFADEETNSIQHIISMRKRYSDSDSSTVAIADLPLSESKDSVCETIVFDRLLSSKERQQVDSYLALKYGLTIDQTAPSSYIGSDGRVVWDAEANSEFSHRICGVCNDTISGLYSTEMYSAADNNLLTMSTDTIRPMSYIVLGDDNGSLKYIHEEGRPKRLGRSWKCSVAGDMPDYVNLVFNAERIEEAYPLEEGEHYWLAVNDSTYYKSEDLGSQNAQFHGVSVVNNMVFTIVAAKGDELPEIEDKQLNDNNFCTISIAPNPTTTGVVRLRIQLREASDIKVSLLDSKGNMYATEKRIGRDFYAISLSLPTQGVWFAVLESVDMRKSYKLIRK